MRRLLDTLGYALHSNDKSISADCPDRNAQFIYMAEEKKQFLKRGLPIISVDTRHRNGHPLRDLRSSAQWRLGFRRHIPRHAAARRRERRPKWQSSGRKSSPGASHVLILADSGGSNWVRVRLWKWALQEEVADRFGLTVTVCHLPTGASK